VRIDPAGRRGLLRLDWLTLAFHVTGLPRPYRVTFTSLADVPNLDVLGARLLQSNLIEITGDDPQIVYTVDLAAHPHLGGSYGLDVELAFAWMGIRGDPLQARPARLGVPLAQRAARKVIRQLGSQP
jgi:hypothetical protein